MRRHWLVYIISLLYSPILMYFKRLVVTGMYLSLSGLHDLSNNPLRSPAILPPKIVPTQIFPANLFPHLSPQTPTSPRLGSARDRGLRLVMTTLRRRRKSGPQLRRDYICYVLVPCTCIVVCVFNL